MLGIRINTANTIVMIHATPRRRGVCWGSVLCVVSVLPDMICLYEYVTFWNDFRCVAAADKTLWVASLEVSLGVVFSGSIFVIRLGVFFFFRTLSGWNVVFIVRLAFLP